MKRNVKKSKKMSAIVAGTWHFGSVLGVLFFMVILNVMASSNCQQLMKVIGDDKRELEKLKEEYERESTRWNEMKTPEKLEAALLKHGLAMKPPRADQNVYMKSDGTPYPCIAVNAVNRRRSIAEAQYKPAPKHITPYRLNTRKAR